METVYFKKQHSLQTPQGRGCARPEKISIRPEDPYPLVSKSGSALAAATGKNFAAVSGGHSFAETVFLGTMTFLGLICS